MSVRQIQFNDLGNVDILQDCIIGDHLHVLVECDELCSSILYLELKGEELPPTLRTEGINYVSPYQQLMQALSIDSRVVDSVENRVLRFNGGRINWEFHYVNEIPHLMLDIKIKLTQLAQFNR